MDKIATRATVTRTAVPPIMTIRFGLKGFPDSTIAAMNTSQAPMKRMAEGATTTNSVRNLDRGFWKASFMDHRLRRTTHAGRLHDGLAFAAARPELYGQRGF